MEGDRSVTQVDFSMVGTYTINADLNVGEKPWIIESRKDLLTI